jgi:hypothetical protein
MEGSEKSDFRSTTRDVKKILEGFNKDRVDAVIDCGALAARLPEAIS